MQVNTNKAKEKPGKTGIVCNIPRESTYPHPSSKVCKISSAEWCVYIVYVIVCVSSREAAGAAVCAAYKSKNTLLKLTSQPTLVVRLDAIEDDGKEAIERER